LTSAKKDYLMDEVNQSEGQEVAPPMTENHESQVEAQAAPVETAEESRQDRNWKEINRAKKELERELRLSRDMNEKLVQAQLDRMNPPKAVEVDELDSIDDSEFIPKGKVKSLVRKEAEKIAKEISQKEYDRISKEREASQYLHRLKSQYSDFDEIVNSQTLSLLEEQDPELAELIVSSKDPYKIGMQSYKYIKAMNIAEKVPEARRSKEVDKKIEQNAKTVQTPQAYDKRPMAQAFVLTDTEKKKLYQEMNSYANMASGVPEMR